MGRESRAKRLGSEETRPGTPEKFKPSLQNTNFPRKFTETIRRKPKTVHESDALQAATAKNRRIDCQGISGLLSPCTNLARVTRRLKPCRRFSTVAESGETLRELYDADIPSRFQQQEDELRDKYPSECLCSYDAIRTRSQPSL